MRFLLDTHTFIWAAQSSTRLPLTVKEVLSDLANDVYISAASIWELSTKYRLGKLPEVGPILDRPERILQAFSANPLSITHQDAALAGSLDWEHRDPFDRMLAAQAVNNELTLVTKDRRFLELSQLSVLW